jgi:iron(III) transport system ATP-binding protein
MTSIIDISDLSHAYGNQTSLLQAINLQIQAGEIISILGPSGCGKTTLLRIIAGLERHSQGKVKINDSLVSSPNFSLPPEQRNIGLVVQEKALFPHLTVEKNVTFGIQASKNKTDIALEYLQLFKVDHLKNKYPHEISGGEQQRVALARSMAPNPTLLLLDEPFSALDEKLKNALHKETKKIFKEKGLTVVIVSHDKQEAQFFSDKIFTIENGQIIQIG